ncbi:MAG: ATP-binding protein [Coriobacteriia bacterium]|nr:ATP-binding protein [Coriobacteriia bacterium]
MNLQARIDELERQLSELPAGSVVQKKVHGSTYCYHRWSEGGKRRERYLKAGEAEPLREAVARRKQLEGELKELRRAEAGTGRAPIPAAAAPSASLQMNVLVGERLRAFGSGVEKYRRRELFGQLEAYLSDDDEKVLILFGLRRTGKTTMIRQAILRMGDAELGRAAFIQAVPGNTLSQLNHDLRLLESRGVRFVFVDEVTALDDFVGGAALLSDIFVAGGMRVVLSGTDSLGFVFAQDDQLYDRCRLLHTTYIPYREFSEVLGIHGIDEYIRFGGTMSLGGADYSASSPFSTAPRAGEYVDAAVARNIQHSLACYDHGGHFRHLRDLYDADELTSAVNRVVEYVNHRFALEVLSRDFTSHDLGISAANLRRDRAAPTDILDRVDVGEVTWRLRELLEIRNAGERSVELEPAHAVEIGEYLDLLDLTDRIEVRSLPDVSGVGARTVVCQPGLRYAQVEALIQSLMLDQTFSELSLAERNVVEGRIRTEVMGRMLEDIVLLETKRSRPGCEVFVLQFAVGEFDMVVFDPKAASCEIYEVKHSDQVAAAQRRHLLDPQKRRMCEHRYGPITGSFVLYRGADDYIDGVQYVNVEEYLS